MNITIQLYYLLVTFTINLKAYELTFEKWLSPSLTKGVVGNIRCGDMVKAPLRNVYKLLITSIKSDVFFTGKNLLRGTWIPKIKKNVLFGVTDLTNFSTFFSR